MIASLPPPLRPRLRPDFICWAKKNEFCCIRKEHPPVVQGEAIKKSGSLTPLKNSSSPMFVSFKAVPEYDKKVGRLFRKVTRPGFFLRFVRCSPQAKPATSAVPSRQLHAGSFPDGVPGRQGLDVARRGESSTTSRTSDFNR